MREQLNEVWYAVHTLRDQDPDGLTYNRWDDVCGALAQIAEALGHEGFEAEEPENAGFNHDVNCKWENVEIPHPEYNVIHIEKEN
jgi:hypothetical protein